MTVLAWLLVGWLVVSWLAAWQIAWPLTGPVRLPAGLDETPEEAEFESDSETLLSGWWFAHGPAPSVVLAHGAFEHRGGVADCVAPLRAAGYNVLSFDFRGRGNSGGGPSTLGWRETADLRAALAWVRARPEAAGQPLGVVGFSMGASAAVFAAAAEPDLAVLVLDSAYATMASTMDAHLSAFLGPCAGVLGAPVRYFGRRLMNLEPARVRPVDVAAALAPRPVLLIHGADDRMTPVHNSSDLQAAIGEGAQLWVVPGARHCQARRVAPREYWARVLACLASGLARG